MSPRLDPQPRRHATGTPRPVRPHLLFVGILATSLPTAAEPGYIGLRTTALPPEVRAQIPNAVPAAAGLLITHVVPRSPADRAGLQRFDVLVKVGPFAINTPQQLDAVLARSLHGAKLATTLVRAGSTIERAIAVESPPPDANRSPDTAELRRAALPFASRQSAAGEDKRTGIALADGPIAERAILLTTRDGKTFAAKVSVGDEAWTWNVPAEKSATKPDAPERHADRVTELIAGSRDERTRGVFRFRVQPRADGDDRSVVLLIQQPGEDGEYRVLEVEHPLVGETLPVDRLLALDALDAELDRIAPTVRGKLEAALRKYRVPPVQARVRLPQ